MGQAVDLPDPLDAESPLNAQLNSVQDSAAPGESADDLLSQLAGDEIDRLLAEADVERGPDGGEPEVDAPFAPGPSISPINAATETAPEVVAVPENLQSVLDGVDSLAATTAALSSIAEDDLDAHLTSASFDDAAEVADPSITAEHLNLHAHTDETPAHAAESADEEFERPLPVVLKPLAWLNAPFDAMSDAIREILGKVALLTLFNAVAVLVYVLVFRH